jgi:hypothetical protein
MRGVAHGDPIELMIVAHSANREGAKIARERYLNAANGSECAAKLLKKQAGTPRVAALPWCLLDIKLCPAACFACST